DLPQAAAADNPFIHVLTGALGGALGRALVWLCVGAMWFCGLASITSNSRMLFAFARDGGLPGSALVARVSERYRTPHVAIWISVLTALFVLPPNQIAGLTFAGCLVLLALYWSLWMRQRFRGPKVALAGEAVRP